MRRWHRLVLALYRIDLLLRIGYRRSSEGALIEHCPFGSIAPRSTFPGLPPSQKASYRC